MSVLPDYLAVGLRVVFCGTAAGNCSAAAGHYYAGPGNEFWPLLFESGILPVRLKPSDDAAALRYGIGLTDLVKERSASRDSSLEANDYDVQALVEKLERCLPARLAFHGKTSAAVVSRWLRQGAHVSLGRQGWTLGGVPVFVLPSASGANRSTSRLEGLPSRLAWFQALAGELPAPPADSPGSPW